MSPLKEGDQAPDFTLPDDEGQPFRLKEALQESNVILYFYPRDFTPGCEAEAQGFRDEAKMFLGLDAVVVGISTGTVRSKAEFKKRFGLNFRLVADEQKVVCGLYGAMGLLGITPKRVTFVIARDGTIKRVHEGVLPLKHVEAAIEALFQLRHGEAGPAASAA